MMRKIESEIGVRTFQLMPINWSTRSLGKVHLIQIMSNPRVQLLAKSQKKEGAAKI